MPNQDVPGPNSAELREQVIEKFVYFPLGIASAVLKAAPKATEGGKKLVGDQVKAAEFVGRMAVTFLKSKYDSPEAVIKDVASTIRGAAESRIRNVTTLFGQPQDTTPGVSDVADGASEAEAEVETEVGGIEGYDELTASQIIVRLEGLDKPSLERIERHELEHRRRRTILAKLSQLRDAAS